VRKKKKIWLWFFGLLILTIISSIVFGVCWKQKWDAAFFVKDLSPLVNYVENFRNAHGRLPNEEEFNSWTKANFNDEGVEYYSSQPSFIKTWGIQGQDFVIGKLEIKHMLYYRSWDKKLFSN
jgi:hypothetical protein